MMDSPTPVPTPYDHVLSNGKVVCRSPFVRENGDLIWLGARVGADLFEDALREWIAQELNQYLDPLSETIHAEHLRVFVRTLLERMLDRCAYEVHEQIVTRLYEVLVGDES
jgi:hypothetical protein